MKKATFTIIRTGAACLLCAMIAIAGVLMILEKLAHNGLMLAGDLFRRIP